MAKRVGTCQLMGTTGPLRKSHLIPNAFMRRTGPEPFLESDGKSRTKKRQTGWYDECILGIAGENLIASYDDEAARCFIDGGFTYRRRRLPSDPNLLIDDFVASESYMVHNADVRKIRLFAMSLLWRAAVSTLMPFAHIRVSASHMRDIGGRLRTGQPGHYLDYPTWFGVFNGTTELPKIVPVQSTTIPFIRFFLDGVVCYISPRRRVRNIEKFSFPIMGEAHDRFSIHCFESAGSWHDVS
ncbi:MAG: hypothetical protein KYX66_06625, partial [Blastomonas fulva]|uniref:hypothetical protein n=1 Tax=Blastomonas fulva TaxID=1550728 RepID=UPI0024E22510